MKISRGWISDFLEEFKIKPEEVAERLSSTLAEVEGIERRGEWLDEKVVVGKIVDLVSHPNADKLKLAKVTIGKKTFDIVCGAPNIKSGQIVPLVLTGGRVKSPKGGLMVVGKAKIRGVESEGMMCSRFELGVGEDHSGIWILPEEWEKYLGKPLIEVLPEIKDVIWEIENKALTHRPDCFSQLGMAREVAAAFRLKFKLPQWYRENWQPKNKNSDFPLRVEVVDSQRCPRYSAVVITDVKVAPSPLWFQQRLINVGLRPINNIVDVTNYILMELGQPMHAFDGEKIEGGKIIVRQAKEGETIITLDGETRRLGEEDLIIADKKKPVAVAGIMGGANSEVDEKTKTVILESANFSKGTIRRSSMRLGLRTEASLRFEKGLDPNLTLVALARAVALISQFWPRAKVASSLVDIYPQPVKPKIIKTSPEFINRILGGEIKSSQMVTILNSLQLKTKLDNQQLVVKVPTFRRDLSIPEDLVEEVGRIYGYDRLPLTLPQRDLSPAPVNFELDLARKVKQILVALGFDEIYTYAFVGAELYRKCRLNHQNLIPLKNPISPELTFLKDSLCPTLIEKAALNRPNFDQFALFELAKVFRYQKEKEKLPRQPKMLAGIMVSSQETDNQVYLACKGAVEELLERILLPRVNFQPSRAFSHLHPGKTVKIYSGKKEVGFLGVLHPLVAGEFGLEDSGVALFELNFDLLKGLIKKQIDYSPPIRETLVKIDLTLKAKNWSQVVEKIEVVFGRWLVKTKLVDHYQDKYTVRLWLLPSKKTAGKNLQELIEKVILR